MINVVAQTADTASLAERLLLAATGLLVGALVGTGLIGWIVWRTADRTQARRTIADRALEQHRADNELRHELLTSVMKTASALYLANQIYRRATEDPNLSEDDRRDARRKLDEQYHKSRTESRLIETKMEVAIQLG